MSVRILLIEDSDVDAGLVQAHLRSEPLLKLTRAETFAGGSATLEGGAIDVVLLDLNLVDSFGLETFTQLHERFPDVPIVILSGHNDLTWAKTAISQGAQDYVPKNELEGHTLIRSIRYAIERQARLLAERRNRDVERDLAAARQIQRHLLPTRPPSIAGYDVAGHCRSADATGGDFYDFIPLNDGTWGFVVADVSSHGFAPALIMVGTRRTIRSMAQTYTDLGRVLSIANDAATEDLPGGQFVTVFLAHLDPNTHAVDYSTAGHLAHLFRVSGEVTELSTDGMPLGVLKEGEFASGNTVHMNPGDLLLMMTDGVWEAESLAGEPFGIERVFTIVQEHRQQTAAEICEAVMQNVNQFCAPNGPNDDVTILVLRAVDR